MKKNIVAIVALVVAVVTGLYLGKVLDKYQTYRVKIAKPVVSTIQTTTQSYIMTTREVSTPYVNRRSDQRCPIQFIEAKPQVVKKQAKK